MTDFKMIRSLINRANFQLEYLNKSEIFTPSEKQILKPHYEEEIRILEQKMRANVCN
jgi:hypothetical protein